MYSYLNTITILSCHIDIYEFMKNNETIRKYYRIISYYVIQARYVFFLLFIDIQVLNC